MTAPGMHLEFGESNNYQRKVGKVAGLEDLVKARLKQWPQAGVLVCGQVREVRIVLESWAYAVVYIRRGQQIRFLELFGLPEGEPELEDYLVTVKDLFCGGSR